MVRYGERMSSFDHHDAIDAAELMEGPAVRNFIRTGTLTPGFRATVQLHSDGALHTTLTGLREYVAARLAADERGAPDDWPMH